MSWVTLRALPFHCPLNALIMDNEWALVGEYKQGRHGVAGEGLMENVTLYFTKRKREKERKEKEL
ncbi:MAG: hypothetical protein M0P99_02910 [Candidatus Cloacimonetes bacterium]|nr:hypothetical protein [Candidatus Cloacimonadota bacterium]